MMFAVLLPLAVEINSGRAEDFAPPETRWRGAQPHLALRPSRTLRGGPGHRAGKVRVALPTLLCARHGEGSRPPRRTGCGPDT